MAVKDSNLYFGNLSSTNGVSKRKELLFNETSKKVSTIVCNKINRKNT